jgi:hypothetical protein
MRATEKTLKKAPYNKDKRIMVKLNHVTGQPHLNPYGVGGIGLGWTTYKTRKEAEWAFKYHTK